MSSRHNQFRPVTRASRRVAAFAAVPAIVAAAACGGKDPYAPTAAYATVSPAAYTLYPASRVRAPYTSALDLFTPNPVRPAVQSVALRSGITLAPNFDVALDVDSTGRILLLHPKQLVSTPTVPKTGFQTSGTRFDSLGSAPTGSYEQDSTVRVSVGQTVVVQAQGVACYDNGTFFYAKLVVDAYDAASGALTVRVTVDKNCGFRSFATGIPTS